MTAESADAAKARKQFNPFRPIETMEEARDAARAGYGLGVIVMISYAVGTAFAAFAGKDLVANEAIDVFYYIGNGVALVLAALLTLWAWARRSLIAAMLLAVWVAIEFGYKIIAAPQTVNFLTIVLLAIAFTCTVLSIRGHLVMGRLKKTGGADPAVFE